MNVTPETEWVCLSTHCLARLLENELGRWAATCSCGTCETALTAEGAARAWSDHLVQVVCDEAFAAAHRRQVLDQEVRQYDNYPERNLRGAAA